MNFLKKYILLFILLIQNPLQAQETVIEQLRSLQEESRRRTENSIDEVRRLEDESARLKKKLEETNQQLGVLKGTNLSEPQTKPISLEEIARYFENKNFKGCSVTVGDHIGEYYIRRDKVKIRFVFLTKDDTLSPKASFVKGEQGEDLLQIFQTGYTASDVNKEGAMTATIRFRFNSPEGPTDVVHAVFTGQRVEDKFFGYKSSFNIDTLTCVL